MVSLFNGGRKTNTADFATADKESNQSGLKVRSASIRTLLFLSVHLLAHCQVKLYGGHCEHIHFSKPSKRFQPAGGECVLSAADSATIIV